ncbi:high mobility group [Coemansia sp. RSA 2399]|nr:high mobility group [Coemansia sp. RSA 2399]KAJ1907771.1 high mobility group [Coemansia sp. IMI 209127]
MTFAEAKHTCKKGCLCFGGDGHISNTPSSDEEPSSTNSTLTSSGNDIYVYPDTLVMLADNLDMSTNSIVCEGEAIADLVLSLGSHFRRYNQLFVGMQTMLHDLAKKCSERSREGEQRAPNTQLFANRLHHTSRQGVCGPAQALSGLAKQSTPYSFPGHKNKKAATTAPTAKRPLSDFNFFCRDARKLVVEAHPEYTKEQVNKELGRIWSLLDSVSRQHYRQMYIQDKQRYSQDVSALTEKPKSILVGDVQATDRVSGPCGLLGANYKAGQTIWRYSTEHGATAGGMAAGLSISTEPELELNSGMVGNGATGRPGNTLQSILNASPSTSDTVNDPEDADEPLSRTLLSF